jgi:hypothetical protein
MSASLRLARKLPREPVDPRLRPVGTKRLWIDPIKSMIFACWSRMSASLGQKRTFSEYSLWGLTAAGHPPLVNTSRVFSARRNQCSA